MNDKSNNWANHLKDLKFWENMESLPTYLRRRWVGGAKEWLAGLHGSKENNMEDLGYTQGEWEYIWSTMLENGAWAVPSITDEFGNPIKDNLAPEMFIKYIAHDVQCNIVVFDLTLGDVQFCSANHLKDNNVLFEAPILLYNTGTHFQSVHPLDQEYFIQYARNIECNQSNPDGNSSANISKTRDWYSNDVKNDQRLLDISQKSLNKSESNQHSDVSDKQAILSRIGEIKAIKKKDRSLEVQREFCRLSMQIKRLNQSKEKKR